MVRFLTYAVAVATSAGTASLTGAAAAATSAGVDDVAGAPLVSAFGQSREIWPGSPHL